ncbi:hypothetical protein GGS23DRAFT_459532 [Durotheca rogersii]|uniref:uncharacterized protein n=1 Tax=Durotheca rogersii TaxID=419775 RepID=UPI00221FE1EA|nr:uncharacterized protein GGS23DRAFT_459532 [Durotheca rogersii]KAI5864691.1 hypothetical protein GGS23DRAFT_459532 [Durotheca rogersii]
MATILLQRLSGKDTRRSRKCPYPDLHRICRLAAHRCSWNEKAYEYQIVEPAKQFGELGELDGYIFVVRQRVDKRTQEIFSYVDIKSTPLRDALRVVFEHVRHIDLRSNKPSIPQNILFNVLPELRSYQQHSTLDNRTSSHLDELIKFTERTYTDTSCHVQSLLAHGEITYDLLWSLFKPNSLLFTTCSGTRKPRCVRHVCGEEKKNMYGAKYWSLDCRYNDFDGKEFGEVSIEVMVPKFHGLKPIHELEAFPIQYHPHFDEVKSELIDCGKRFVSLRGAHHRHCKGAAFFLSKGEPVELHVDSRVMIDTESFKEANPTYRGPKINGAATQRAVSISFFTWGSRFGDENDRNNETNESTECGRRGWTDETDESYEEEPTDPSPTPERHGEDQKDMTEEAVMLCCPTAK